ncbi:MAG: 3-deoxy-manno-octulosonate cytidylyltransferase [Pseudomonadota bacterium]|jgi:3-deoxy-manno-octulosonate cytidylyltransferase (CMP-KDO synthetase)|nr:3-deoxy-manno-octulosonate cytidylyltransferase [Pseudomonadota bacterium]
MSDPLVLIPARLAATRLPNKPLADIVGEPMIVRTWRRAVAAEIGPVAVATDAPSIREVIEREGGRAVMTRDDHASGSDRIAEAMEIVDPEGRHDVVVNVQGDFPTIDPRAIAASVLPLADPAVDIATLVYPIEREDEKTNPNVVKMVGTEVAPGRFRTLYFTRATAPSGEGPLYHHIGVYAYRRAALKRFVSLPPSPLEVRERLEQLRAIEAGLRIDATVVDDVPFGVDTPQQLEEARALLTSRKPR